MDTPEFVEVSIRVLAPVVAVPEMTRVPVTCVSVAVMFVSVIAVAPATPLVPARPVPVIVTETEVP